VERGTAASRGGSCLAGDLLDDPAALGGAQRDEVAAGLNVLQKVVRGAALV